MAGVGIDVHIGRRVGHDVCALGSCEEGELCPHAVHMELWMEDGREGDALNAWAGCRQWMEQCRPRQQRIKKALAIREGVLEAGDPLGVLSTRLALGGEENSSDPTMIGYKQLLHKTNQLHWC